jgi:hypothetical protein
MLVLHVHVLGRNGSIERSYDFMRNDGKDALEGCDIVIPYDKEIPYPLTEPDVIAQVHLIERSRGDH